MLPWRFGLLLSSIDRSVNLREIVHRAEGCGIDIILMSDHIQRQAAVFSTLGALSVLSKVRIGTLVLSNELRHPLIAAKELAMLDVLSEGRLEVGLGLGWNRTAFLAAGIPFPAYSERVSRLTQSIEIMRSYWTGEPMDVQGAYHISGLTGDPLPVQKPHPPILLPLGCGRALALAAKAADTVEVSRNGASRQEVADLLHQLGASVVDGRKAPEIAALILAVEPARDSRRLRAEADRRQTSVDDLLHRPAFLAGTVAAMTEELERRRAELGVSYHIVSVDDLEAFEPLIAELAG